MNGGEIKKSEERDLSANEHFNLNQQDWDFVCSVLDAMLPKRLFALRIYIESAGQKRKYVLWSTLAMFWLVIIFKINYLSILLPTIILSLLMLFTLIDHLRIQHRVRVVKRLLATYGLSVPEDNLILIGVLIRTNRVTQI